MGFVSGTDERLIIGLNVAGMKEFVHNHGDDWLKLNELLAPNGKDGLPLMVGEVVYGEDEKAWVVERYDHSKRHSVVCSNAGVTQELKPEWLTHEGPDSFTKITEDIEKWSKEYWGCVGESCCNCPVKDKFGGMWPTKYYKTLDCRDAKNAHIRERIEKLAKNKGVW